MARLHTLYLPGDSDRFAFILDQVYAPEGIAEADRGTWGDILADRWRAFADACGATAIIYTPETIEILDPFASTLDQEPERDNLGEQLRGIHEMFGRLGRAFMEGIEECGPDCDCAKQPTDDAPATDNPPSGDDGAPAETLNIGAHKRRLANPPLAPEAELSERERRVEKILTAGMATVRQLDSQGEPIGEPYTFSTSGITIDHEGFATVPRGGIKFPIEPAMADAFEAMPPLELDSSLLPKGPVRVMCGAMNSAQQPCSLELGHEYLHRFMSEA